MSSQTPDSVASLVSVEKGRIQDGTTALQVVKVSGIPTTGSAVMNITGTSTLSANEIMHVTLVAGASTSLTTAGFIRVQVTDSGGNLTDGSYYIPFGTLS